MSTTPSKVNKALKEKGINGEIVRDNSGYYYFAGELSDKVPSIFSNNLRGFSTEQVIKHVTDSLQKV